MKNKNIFTLIIPINNGDSTIEKTFNSIIKQKNIDLIKTIILVNDGSTDKSEEKINSFKKENKLNVKIINHLKAKGLAASFNQAIKMADSDFIILAHQDIILDTKLALVKFKKIIDQNPNIFYIFPTICHPKNIWNNYNFWQKCLFARYVNTEQNAPIEKFDCVNRQQLINLGLFDETHFRTAGEDIDLIIRAKNLKYIASKIKVIHLHNKNPNFSFKDLVKKEKQLAETKGVLLRMYGLKIPNLRSFFREAILIGLFIPKINIIAIILLIIYIFGYNWRMYTLIFQDNKVLLLPFINFYLFIANITSSTKAFFNKKQII